MWSGESRPEKTLFGERAVLWSVKEPGHYSLWILLNDPFLKVDGAITSLSAFERAQKWELITHVGVMGGFTLLALYNFILLFLGANLSLYLPYLIYVISMIPSTFISLRQVDALFLLSSTPLNFKWSVANFCLNVITGSLFFRAFMKLGKYFDRIFWVVFACSAIASLATLIEDDLRWISIQSIFLSLGTLLVTAPLAWRGHSAARQYLLCWSPLLVTFPIYLLGYFLSPTGVPDVIINIFSFSLLLEGVLFASFLGKSLRHLEEKKRQAELKLQTLQHSLLQGKAVQESLLPAIPKFCSGFEIAPFYQAAEQISGDWYNCSIDPYGHRLFLAIGDLTGHGIGAAILAGLASGITQTTLAEMIEAKAKSEDILTEVMKKTNRGLRDTVPRQ